MSASSVRSIDTCLAACPPVERRKDEDTLTSDCTRRVIFRNPPTRAPNRSFLEVYRNYV
jgi:hypothetical protein